MSNIIICEDEKLVALNLKNRLNHFGYHTIGIYDSAEEVMKVCKNVQVDLVLMDIHLNGRMDGIEAAACIYQDCNIPVILMTAYADESMSSRIKYSLPFGYIVKPFDERELKTTIEIALFRHGMEQKVKRSEERYRRLFEEAPSANFTANLDGAITSCNSAFARLLGFTDTAALLSKSLVDFFFEGEGIRILKNVLSNPPQLTEEWMLRGPENKAVHVVASILVNSRKTDTPRELRGYLVDITQIKELESQLRQAQKMETIGRLSSGIAHDFNNIITVITGYCGLLMDYAKEYPFVSRETEGILAAARRAANLTRQLLAFSRNEPAVVRVAEADACLRNMESLMRRLIAENMRISFNLSAGNAHIAIDPGQFEQIIINLIINARDAMADHGTVTLATSTVKGDGGGAHHGIAPGEWYCVIVRDNGSGIAKEHLDLIFDPFFSTKGKDAGTGLGLSIAASAVKGARGSIFVESEAGRGTDFYVYFPIVPGEEKEAAPEGNEGAAAHRRGVIMIAEDDEDLKTLLAAILAKAGHEVLLPADAEDAGRMAAEHRDFLLLSDLVMPGISGTELAETLAEKHGDMKILFMSGYEADPELPPLLLGRKTAFIKKPFYYRQLLDAIDGLLQA